MSISPKQNFLPIGINAVAKEKDLINFHAVRERVAENPTSASSGFFSTAYKR